MRRRSLLAIALALALVACNHNGASKDVAAHDGAGPAFDWPAPEGWRKETIPFPLEFAPDLPFRGVEEIRFAPGFFDPGAPGYFSYAFVWWLEGRPDLDRASLERALGRYFAGLCDAVGGKKFAFDAARFKATLAPSTSAPSSPGRVVLDGTVDAYDPFEKGNGRELTLHVELSIWDCPAAGRRVLLVKASPKPRSEAIWTELGAREASFRCR